MGRSLFFVVHFWRILGEEDSRKQLQKQSGWKESIPYGKGKVEVFQNSDGSTKLYQFPMGKVEELSKSLIWHTTPMQGSPKKRSILANADWLRATAKDVKV